MNINENLLLLIINEKIEKNKDHMMIKIYSSKKNKNDLKINFFIKFDINEENKNLFSLIYLMLNNSFIENLKKKFIKNNLIQNIERIDLLFQNSIEKNSYNFCNEIKTQIKNQKNIMFEKQIGFDQKFFTDEKKQERRNKQNQKILKNFTEISIPLSKIFEFVKKTFDEKK